MSTTQLQSASLRLNKPHEGSPCLSHPHQTSTSLTWAVDDGPIYANFEEPIRILNLCLWNRRALFATLHLVTKGHGFK
jgi:hypothetical protein